MMNNALRSLCQVMDPENAKLGFIMSSDGMRISAATMNNEFRGLLRQVMDPENNMN
jgi:hypothetical protein